MALPAAFLAAAGAAALVYYTGFRETRSSRRWPYGGAAAGDDEDDERGRQARAKRPRLVLPRLSLFASRFLDRPPTNCVEAVAMMVASLRIVYSETIGKWPVGDLFFGLAFMWRRRKQSDVGRIYAEDTSSDHIEVTGRGPELIQLKRLVSLCFCFARRSYNDMLRDFDFKPEDILVYEPKAKLLAPAFAVIVEEKNEWVLVLVRGTHSHKDRFTCATCVGVPFHHTVLADPEWQDGEVDMEGRSAVRCLECGRVRRRMGEAGAEEEDDSWGPSQAQGFLSVECQTCQGSSSEEGTLPLTHMVSRSASYADGSRNRAQGKGKGVKQIVLGYAHCGMVAAARAMAQRITGLLQATLQKHAGFTVKVVGHSLGGATAAMLTFILREKEGLEDTTCVSFGPAAAMTWDLAESGQCCVTSIINGADFVPTISASAIDDLRAEVRGSAWANDLREQLHKMRALRIILQSVASLRRQVAAIRASTLAMGTKASRQLYARLQAATTARAMVMALRSVNRRAFLCFPRGPGQDAVAGPGADRAMLLFMRRPVLRFFQRACSSLPILLTAAASAVSVQSARCSSCCPGVGPGGTSPFLCSRCRHRSAPLPLLPGFASRRSIGAGVDSGSMSKGEGATEGYEMRMPATLGGDEGHAEEWAPSLRAVDAEGHMRMDRDAAPGSAEKAKPRWQGYYPQLQEEAEEVLKQSDDVSREDWRGLAVRRRGGSTQSAGAGSPAPSVPSTAEPEKSAKGSQGSMLREKKASIPMDASAAPDEEEADDAAAGLAALLHAMTGGVDGDEEGDANTEGRVGVVVDDEEAAFQEALSGLSTPGRGAAPTWREMEERLREAALGQSSEGMALGISEDEVSVMEGIIREEQALEAALAEERAESTRSLSEGFAEEQDPRLPQKGLFDRVDEEEEDMEGRMDAGEDNASEDSDSDDEEIRDPRRWYPCGRLIHLVWNTWDGEDQAPGPGASEDAGSSRKGCLQVRQQQVCDCTRMDLHAAGEGMCSSLPAGAAAVDMAPAWRVGMFEVDRRLYGRIKLSGNMVSDHLMANYMKSLQALIAEAEREERSMGQTHGHDMATACNIMTCT